MQNSICLPNVFVINRKASALELYMSAKFDIYCLLPHEVGSYIKLSRIFKWTDTTLFKHSIAICLT